MIRSLWIGAIPATMLLFSGAAVAQVQPRTATQILSGTVGDLAGRNAELLEQVDKLNSQIADLQRQLDGAKKTVEPKAEPEKPH